MVRSTWVALGVVAMTFMSGCDATQPVAPGAYSDSGFVPDSMDVDTLPVGNSARIRWFQGYYTVRWDTPGINVQLAKCASPGETLYWPEREFTTEFEVTDFDMTALMSEFRPLYDHLRNQVGLTERWPSTPFVVPGDRETGVYLTAVSKHVTVPITAYLDRWIDGSWVKDGHIAPTLKYRNMIWSIYFQDCHDQGSGG